MKFMKLGTRPDMFYTEEATRTVISDVCSDLIIKISNVTYLLHKGTLFYQSKYRERFGLLQWDAEEELLLPKCGLLQRLCSGFEDSKSVTMELHDIPGGDDAFELCAKFCYGITINVSAHNIVPAFCAAKFLRMTEAIEKGNLVLKLEAFFNSCVLEGWKDSVLALQTTEKLPEWSQNLGITRRCIDSVIEKILTPPAKVTWSYTYTRPGYAKKWHQFVPMDWWTEDISDLHIDLFRCVITAVGSANMLSPQLIGEALHVYASRWLPDTTKSRHPEISAPQTEDVERKQRILETIANMIPGYRESVSVGFLLRLLSIANFLGASPVTKEELIRRSSVQLEEATVNDLLFPSHSSFSGHFYDVDLVGEVLQSFLVQWKRQHSGDKGQYLRAIRKVGKLIDSYIQVVARDVNMSVSKFAALAQAVPEIARHDHDDLYKAINIYLKDHPDLVKAEKRQLCSILDCQKLSPVVRAHAVRNERIPLRTVVQILFFEQERVTGSTISKLPPAEGDLSKLKISSDEKSRETEEGITTRTTMPNVTERSRHKATKSEGKLTMESEQNVRRKEAGQTDDTEKGRAVVREEGSSGSKFEFPSSSDKIIQRKTNKSDRSHSKGRSSR